MSRKANKKHRRGLFYKPLSFLIISIAIIAGMSVFFKISDFGVIGNVRCSPEAVIEASGVQVDDNLFFINKFSITNSIFKQLPYVSEVKLHRKLPGTLVFEIKESEAAAAIYSEGKYVIINEDCKILEKSDELHASIIITGVTVIQPEVGKSIEL